MDELKKLFFDYKKAVDSANKADNAWEENPCSEELEAEFDRTYRAEFELYEKLLNAIIKISGISRGTAATMINSRIEDLEVLFCRIE